MPQLFLNLEPFVTRQASYSQGLLPGPSAYKLRESGCDINYNFQRWARQTAFGPGRDLTPNLYLQRLPESHGSVGNSDGPLPRSANRQHRAVRTGDHRISDVAEVLSGQLLRAANAQDDKVGFPLLCNPQDRFGRFAALDNAFRLTPMLCLRREYLHQFVAESPRKQSRARSDRRGNNVQDSQPGVIFHRERKSKRGGSKGLGGEVRGVQNVAEHDLFGGTLGRVRAHRQDGTLSSSPHFFRH